MSKHRDGSLALVSSAYKGWVHSETMPNTFSMPFGILELDQSIGRIRKKRMYLIGGFSGVGKSYFAVNVVNALISQNPPLRVCVFSTELSDIDYTHRLACMREGIWESEFEAEPKKYSERLRAQADEIGYLAKASTSFFFGHIFDVEEMQRLVAEIKPDIVFIDYIQEVRAAGISRMDQKMPALKSEVQRMTIENDCAVFVLSQVNQSAANKSYDDEFGNPFNWAVDFYNAAHSAIKLVRERIDGVSQPVLTGHVLKGRSSGESSFKFGIGQGYKLQKFSKWRSSNVRHLI